MKGFASATVLATILSVAATARAAPITYRIGANEQFSLGPVASAIPVPVFVTAKGDTADAFAIGPGIVGVPLTDVTFGVPLASGTITTPLDFVSNQATHTGGFFTAAGLSSVLAESAAFFSTYNGIGNAGPIPGLPADLVNVTVSVSVAGSPILSTLFFNNVGNGYSFTAAVPEPMTLALLGVGLLGIGTVRLRRGA